ncbi:class I SAM-dependent methyltransferase [Marinagarivorans cellulosilyticus]|uniref:Methyltransferase domain-containing protein n=1 Tax=Marinagarivorans cellulosilyticus TaxID=2721545 RepID=A0AAN1WIH6_9GAMM|nr:class I SAM-dependent methyltransferase [Marinagarivorans cellulosilyticus]BCD98189.1 hypothetical protein MARGE09_P2390 [Marinagarivorans cellulosilyticus]
MDTLKKYTQANRAAWNQAMPFHQKAHSEKWDACFSQQGFSVFKQPELGQLNTLGVKGKNVAHLCCNNGIELMSLKNMGAANCVGFDIADEAIKEATSRTKRYNINCRFERFDIYDIPARYNAAFDMVYISAGCLGWMPDLDLFFKKVSALLNDTGVVFIHEIHPVAEMLPDDNSNDDPLKITEPYFKSEPYEENCSLDYVGREDYSANTQYWFVWTMANIITALISNGFNIRQFAEYPHDVSANHRNNQNAGIAIPLSYILCAHKA